MPRIHPLAEGTYALTRDIENPKPGRHSNHDWRTMKLYRKGFKVVVEHERFDKFSALGDETFMSIGAPGGFQGVCAHTRPDLFGLLVAHLEPVTEAPSDYLARVRWSHLQDVILDRLHAAGLFTMADVEKALQGVLAESDATETKDTLTEVG